MDATTIMLECLKNNGFINDITKARKEVKTEIINLKKSTDLFIRDSIIGMGTIIKEDLVNHYYITTVKMGLLGNVETQAIIVRKEEKAEIVVYAHEGIIKQHLAENTIEKLKKTLSQVEP